LVSGGSKGFPPLPPILGNNIWKIGPEKKRREKNVLSEIVSMGTIYS
jgi:hypothetical protein